MTAIWLFLLLFLVSKQVTYFPILFAVADISAHLFKRLIFTAGEQPRILYSAVVGVPYVFVLAVFLATSRNTFRHHLPRSGLLLLGYLSWTALLTVASPSGVAAERRLAALQQHVIPALLYFLALSIPTATLGLTAKVLSITSFISVTYGLIQFFVGPTAIDRLWAEHAVNYSLQAAKVHAYLYGNAQEFRVFSFYADPLTWGFLLVATFVLVHVATGLGCLSRPWARAVSGFTAVGLFLGLTRTSWVALLITIGFYRLLLRFPAFRRAAFLLTVSAATFWIVVIGGRMVLDLWQDWKDRFAWQGRIMTRYGTVGTLSARVGADRALGDLLRSGRLLGRGLGYNRDVDGSQNDALDAASDSHNVAVELLLYTGIIGFTLFCAFYWSWLSEIFRATREVRNFGAARPFLWLAAFSIGSLTAGYLNGMTFMSGWFYYLIGLGVRLGLTRRV